MKLGALFGWGIVIYAILYLTWSGFVIYGFTSGYLPHLAILTVLVFVALVAGRSLGFRGWKDILPYSLAWALIAALMDAVFSVPSAGWNLYLDWNVWAGYALAALIPLLAPLTRSEPRLGGKWEW